MGTKRVLYMHTGSGNHGCEAIIRTTSKLLNGPRDMILWSNTKSEDVQYGSAQGFEKVVVPEELKRFSPAYFEALVKRKLFHRENANMEVFLRELFKNNVAISVGGDNYCYEWSAKQAVLLDKEIRKHCASSILWGCSVDPEAITPEVREDLEGFDLITAREPITYQLLKEINPNTVKVADPAFLLERVDLPLPDGFQEGNTVGINVSPLIMKYGTESNLILDNYRILIQCILEETDMSVCLIPHVVWSYNNDLEPINTLYREFGASNRVSRIMDGNCCELKGYIARCRFFVGARTHATIAAYSTCVPTLVVGYSVKSRGIAQDLFGTEEGYVLPVQGLGSEDDLKLSFQRMLEKETEEKDKLVEVIPAYKKLAALAANYLL
ncbi:MAG: polysaccharide pyruvyl transferase family protein [Blautia sp.]